jgi:hypothetical protein
MMDHMAEQVLAKLVELQNGRTDAQMGDLIGVSPSHWRHIKAGRRRLTYRIMQRAVRAFPPLYPIVMRDLAGNDAPAEAAS